MAADGTCWQVAFGTLCSSRDDQAFYPHLRVALATGVCGSQHVHAAYEIAVVKCMMLCVRSLRKILARKHDMSMNSRTLTDGLKSPYTVIFGPFAVQGVHRRFLARSFRIHDPSTLDTTYILPNWT